MDDKRLMLDALIGEIEDNYRESVAFAVVYGSYVTGQTSPKSDVDVVFAGKDQRAYELQRTFIFGGVGYDFFCMPLERVRRIVDEFQPLVSIFASGKLIWADGAAGVAHFAELQQAIQTAAQTTGPTRYAAQVEALLTQIKALVFDHRVAGQPQRQHIQGRLTLLIGDLLARVNRAYFRYGIKRYLEEIDAFELKPGSVINQLQSLTRGVVPTDDLARMVLDLQRFWREIKRQSQATGEIAGTDLTGFYEEAVSSWNKIHHAARIGDAQLTYLAASCLEDELVRLRAGGLSLTPMFEGNATGPAEIAANATINQRELVEVLAQRGIPIVEFDDIADVVAFIRGQDTPGD